MTRTDSRFPTLALAAALAAYALLHFACYGAAGAPASINHSLATLPSFRAMAAHVAQSNEPNTNAMLLAILAPFIGAAGAIVEAVRRSRLRARTSKEESGPGSLWRTMQFIIVLVLLLPNIQFDYPVSTAVFGAARQYQTLPLLLHNLAIDLVLFISAWIAAQNR